RTGLAQSAAVFPAGAPSVPGVLRRSPPGRDPAPHPPAHALRHGLGRSPRAPLSPRAGNPHPPPPRALARHPARALQTHAEVSGTQWRKDRAFLKGNQETRRMNGGLAAVPCPLFRPPQLVPFLTCTPFFPSCPSSSCCLPIWRCFFCA